MTPKMRSATVTRMDEFRLLLRFARGFHRICVLPLLLALIVTSLPSHAGEITVAAASDLKFVLDELVTEFHTNQTAVRVKVTYGSSGTILVQLLKNAPFDLYFSADITYPKKLVEAGLASETNIFPYAIGRIVVWAPKQSPLDVRKLGMASVLAPSVKKIAIANPQHAPYGVAAVAAMKSLKVYDQTVPKLIYGENIAQTAQLVQNGAADVGVIALSLAIAPQMRDAGSYWEVPVDAYPKMEQGGVILNRTKDANAAKAFRDFLLSDHGRRVLKRYGFFLPTK